MMDMMILAQQSGDAALDQARRHYWWMSLMDINLSKRKRRRSQGQIQRRKYATGQTYSSEQG
jgi:hypothetical protein